MNYFEDQKKVLLIAEIGVNHNGDLVLAKEMITAVKSVRRCSQISDLH